MVTSEKRSTTSFGHNTNLLDASFSYATQERSRIILKLSHPQINTKRKVEDDELGIFGAEKYFTETIDEDNQRTSINKSPHDQNACPVPKPKTPSATPSVRSESSWNSRRALLVSNGNDHRKRNGVKSLFAGLGCHCTDKASVQINDNKVQVKDVLKQPSKTADLPHKAKSLPSRRADEDVYQKKFEFDESNIKREDCFTFPVLNSIMPYGKHSELLEVEGGYSRNGGHDDTESDASSDLFEIESFSTNENNMFLAQQAIENNEGRLSNVSRYAPSEASVDWSVVTAAADFSTTDDSTVSRTVKPKAKGSGILSGCTSHRAVRLSGEEHGMIGGAVKAGAMAAPARREWCHRLDSVTPVARFQAGTKLVGVASDSNRGQNGFGIVRSVPWTHSSHHLYIQQ